jgi:hypothetical protein
MVFKLEKELEGERGKLAAKGELGLEEFTNQVKLKLKIDRKLKSPEQLIDAIRDTYAEQQGHAMASRQMSENRWLIRPEHIETPWMYISINMESNDVYVLTSRILCCKKGEFKPNEYISSALEDIFYSVFPKKGENPVSDA